MGAGERFNVIERIFRSNLEIILGRTFTFVDYIEKTYGWTKDIQTILRQERDRREILLREYAKCCEKIGLININRDETKKMGKIIPLSKAENQYQLYNVKNNQDNIDLAADYLKKSYAELSKADFDKIVKNSIIELKTDTNVGDDITNLEEKCSERNMTSYEMMAALVIYAQTGMLPDDQGSDRYLGKPNIYMASKKEIEEKSSIKTRCYGAKRIVQIVYANTSFLAGQKVTAEADSNWTASMSGFYATVEEIHMVLTDPKSDAAKDAEKYKMRPSTLRMKPDKIISKNLEDIEFTLPKYTDKNNIYVYLTDIALPCAYFKCEFEDYNRDNIKIDLYLPSFAEYDELSKNNYKIKEQDENQSDGNQRQSFVIFRKENPELYKVFSNNIEEIVKHSNKIYGGNKYGVQ